MERKHIVIAAVIAVVALGGIVGALITGVGPAPGGGDSGDGGMIGGDETDTPYEDTVVVEDASGSGDADGEGGNASAEQPFTFVIQNITECGNTCRVVNGTIVNQQNSTAEDVTVRSEIYTGGDKIWEGSSDAGNMQPDETFTDSKRVELSYAEAYQVRQNDGEILVKTYVETAETTYVFEETRNVT